MDWNLCRGCSAFAHDLDRCDCCYSNITPVANNEKFCPCIKCLIKCVCNKNCGLFDSYVLCFDYKLVDGKITKID